MRAVWYGRCGPAAEVLQLGERPRPEPGPGEVLVRVAWSGVNPHDTKKRSGWTGAALSGPVIPHSDGSGIIEGVGTGVPEARIGERVWIMHAPGAAAEFTTVHADHAVALPPGVSLDVGACLGVPFMTAHDAVLRDGPVAGQTILVQGGAGAVAGYAIQLAAQGGARVIATISSPEKAEHARQLGAEATIDYRQEDVTAAVMALTDGRGIDRIIEVDFGANLAVDTAVIRPHGVIASYSSTRVREPAFPYYALAPKAVTIHVVQGMLLRHERAEPGKRAATALLAAGALQHPVAARFALERTAEAHALQESGRAVGKILVASGEPG